MKITEFNTTNYWDEYYLKNNSMQFEWYFDVTNYHSSYFDVNNWDKESEILIIGVGQSKIIDFLIVLILF